MSLFLQFDHFDNPMYLKKVGNWVITFLNATSPAEDQPIRLVINSVLPIQVAEHIQPRTIHICQMSDETLWRIESVEYFCSQDNQLYRANLETDLMREMIQNIIAEFKRYDVEIKLIT